MNEEIETVDGIALRSEKPEFDTADLVDCGKCGRSNAPNRAECLYCGSSLGLNAAGTAELKLREVEPWEKAFNVVLIGGNAIDGMTGFDPEMVKRAARSGPPIPIKRVATAEAAATVNERSAGAGIECVIVSDEDLAADRPPTRLRSLCSTGDRFQLTTFNTNEDLEFPAGSLELIVVGRSIEERAEQTLKKKRKSVKEVDGRNLSKDSVLMDLYFSGDSIGFRISESGFDFSVLIERKTMLAGENMKRLVEMLKEANPSMFVSQDYVEKRDILNEVWPLTVRNDSKGIQRVGMSVSFAKAEVVSNIEQFTKYSRLVRRTL